MKDRADYARKGIARGRSLAALSYDQGILICAENPSRTLHKVAEIYDRIAFAGVGKFSEFDSLRTQGIRQADLKGYTYSREDVDARSLANAYAQLLGQVFTHEMKPMEVEILVAEVGVDARHRPAVPHLLRGHDRRRGRAPRCWAATPTPSASGSRPTSPTASTWAPPSGPRSAPWPGPSGCSRPATSKSPSSPAPAPAGPSAASPRPSWLRLRWSPPA